MHLSIEKQTSNWYVVYTCPNSEKKVYGELVRRDIKAFLPTRSILRQWSDRTKKMEVPLFPNYLFVNVPCSSMWTVLMVNGVVKFVSFNGVPAIVQEKEIDMVKQITLGASEITTGNFRVEGERVRVKQGPLSGLVGKVLERKGITRFYVELETVNQNIAFDIDASLLAGIH